MSIETTAAEPTTETQVTQEAKDPGELSFTEYQAYRRTGEMPKVQAEKISKSASAESTPAAQKEVANSESAATEEKEETKDESEADAKAETEDESAKEDQPKKKVGGFQRRINKISAEKAEALREAEYWKREALKGATAPKSDETAPKAVSTTPATEGKPDPDNFEKHSEYVEALTDWKVEQKLRAQNLKAEESKWQTEQQTLVQTFADKAKSFAEKTEDYFDVLSDAEEIAPWSPAVQRIVLKSGPELAYALAKDPKEYARINRMSPVDAAEAVGEFKARIASTKSSEAKTETKKLTQAPKPIEPVSGGNAKVAKSLDDPNLSYTDYVKLRREQMKRRGA